MYTENNVFVDKLAHVSVQAPKYLENEDQNCLMNKILFNYSF